MRQAFIYLTLKCNNNCKMCYMHEHYSKKEEMDFEEACGILQKLKEQGVEKITFLGGEPTMYSRLLELLLYAKELQFPFVRLQTNGQFPSKFFEQDVILECVDAFTFSLDGHTEELNKVMRIGSNFQCVVANIKKALTLNKKIAVNTTVSNVNIDYIFDIIDFLEGLGVPNLYLNLMFDSNEVIMDTDEANRMSEKWKVVCNDIITKYADSSMRIKFPLGFSDKREEENKCLAMNPDRVYVMPNLDQYPCILFVDNPTYMMSSFSWEKPQVMQMLDESKCNESCFWLKQKFRNTNPMCLYHKRDIGRGK